LSARGRDAALAVAAVALAAASVAGCGDDDGDAEAFCPLVADRAGLAAMTENFDPSDRDRALEQLRAIRVELGELRAAAPSEIRGDLDTQIDAAQDLIDALVEVPPGDPAAAVEAVRAAQADMDDLPQATSNLETWTAENC
jgi:transposase